MSKHTPGPWHIQHRTVTGPGGENWGPVAVVAENLRFDSHANAQLIAAAPEMLSALESIRYEVWEYAQQLAHNGPSRTEVERKLAYIDGLIAKATGGGK